MDKRILAGIAVFLLAAGILAYVLRDNLAELRGESMKKASTEFIKLPTPDYSGGMPLDKAVYLRESRREYKRGSLSLSELSQLLWAAGGKTHGGRRSIPSAGGLYPLEFYAVAGEVEGLERGVYRYNPEANALERTFLGDARPALMRASLNQNMVGDAPATIVITGVYERTTRVYGERGVAYVHMEAGHSGQNIYLQAESLGLGTVAVGAFSEEEVSRTLNLSVGENPLYLFPVGRV